MNCAKANEISIVDYLSTSGISPKRKYTNYWWYLAPHRQENNPSFKVNIKTNRWYDVAEDTKGSLVDLVAALHHTNISGALRLLSRNEIKPFPFDKQKSTCSGIVIQNIQPLQNRALIQYLDERCISFRVAQYYLKEVYYTSNGSQNNYFSLAFENDRKGLALRNQYSKTAVSPAYFTTITGKDHCQINIFEGVFDYLSALVYFNVTVPKFDCLVLNSTSHINRVLPMLDQYKKVNLFLDNDKAGNQTKGRVKQAHDNVTDYSKKIYPNHKDFNAFLMESKKKVNSYKFN